MLLLSMTPSSDFQCSIIWVNPYSLHCFYFTKWLHVWKKMSSLFFVLNFLTAVKLREDHFSVFIHLLHFYNAKNTQKTFNFVVSSILHTGNYQHTCASDLKSPLIIICLHLSAACLYLNPSCNLQQKIPVSSQTIVQWLPENQLHKSHITASLLLQSLHKSFINRLGWYISNRQ